MSPTNFAAWQVTAKTPPLEVNDAPYTSPKENEIVIKNAAVAINPVDWAFQIRGPDLFSWVKYPCIMGSDCAGTVVRYSCFSLVYSLLVHNYTSNTCP
jgi:NADPH:quinone reductase-like Zn-dependent oxidoreductase